MVAPARLVGTVLSLLVLTLGGGVVPLELSDAPLPVLHATAARRFSARVVESYPLLAGRSTLLVEHEDGCRSWVLVDHTGPRPRAWQEVELSAVVRSQTRPGMEDWWFLDPGLLGGTMAGCRDHVSSHWRFQHFR